MRFKKSLAILLASAMAMAAFAGCAPKKDGGTTTSKDTGDKTSTTTPAGKDKPELKFNVTTVGFGTDPTGKLVQETWLEKCGEMMGVKLVPNYTYVNMNDYKDKIQIILTGGDIPDLLSLGWVPGGQTDVVKYGEQGIYHELTQYMDKLPNYKGVIDAAKNSSAELHSATGKLYGFYGAMYQPNGNPDFFSSGAVRKDIFDKHNLTIPETVEEWTKAAQELKKLYPDKYPMILNEEWQRPESTLASAYHSYADFQNGVSSYYYDETTKGYVFGPMTDGYKSALTVMNQWYKEGLISPDYFTQTSTDGTAAVASGEAYMIPSVWSGYPASWAQPAQYPDQKWILVPSISAKGVDNPWAFYASSPDPWVMQKGYSVVVGSKTKVLDQMLQLMDLQYSPEILELLNWGIEGTTFTKEGGVNMPVEKLIGDGDYATSIAWGQGLCRSGIFPNPQDTTFNAAIATKQNYFYQGKVIEDKTMPEFMKEFYKPEMAYPQSKVWPKPTPLTSDESQEFTNIMAPVHTFAAEQEAKFVKGDRSLAEWPKYLEELNKMGDIKKALDIYTSKLPEQFK